MHPVLVCETFFWIRCQPRIVRKCSRQFLDSIKEDFENIALSVLFRTTRITLHCPIHGSSLSNCCWMGCRRYSAASRLEVPLDEDDFRSFWRALELGNYCFLHNCMWQSWYSEVNVYFLLMGGLLSTHGSFRSCLIYVYVFVYNLYRHWHGTLDGFWSIHGSSRSCWVFVQWRFSPFLIIGFLVWVGFVGCLCCFQRLLNPILSSNYLWRKSWEVVEVTKISRIWFLQIPSQQLLRYSTLGVYRKEWLHCILFDRTSILYVEQAVYRPYTPYLGVFSTSFACMMQDVVWSSQVCTDLCVPYSWDSQP